jgi:hypothetical protein
MSGILGYSKRFFATMKSHLRLRSACVLLVWAALTPGSVPARADEIRSHFDSDSLMRTPGFFDLVVLGESGAARWLILDDPNPPSVPYRLAQVTAKRPEGSIAAALRRNVELQDGSVSTFVKRNPGRAGLVLRMADPQNFLLLLADTATGELVLSSYRDGKSSELGRGSGAFDRGWEKITVKLSGPSVAVSVNEKPVFDAKDPRPASGRVGLATAGPGEASFDELLIVK